MIEGYGASVEHHAALINSFSFGFVNLYALFNAGAFSAIVAILPTEFGKELTTKFPVMSMWTLALFALGFVFSTGLMAVIMQYGVNKYRYYRNLLRENGATTGNPDQNQITTTAILLVIPMLLCTVIGIYFAIYMIIYK